MKLFFMVDVSYFQFSDGENCLGGIVFIFKNETFSVAFSLS